MVIDKRHFSEALAAAVKMSDEQLRNEAGSGKSRSYYVAFEGRAFPLKAVLRLAYKLGGVEWDRPQSSKAARVLKSDFEILHITTQTEKQRLQRQRESFKRWCRDPRFRADVLNLYGSTCVISGCSLPEAIDAAHLCAVGEEGEDKPENGIVLRADLHRLFDAQPIQMAIDPKTLTVHFSEECREHYEAYEGRRIELPEGGPDWRAFVSHWKQFRRRRRLRPPVAMQA